MTLRKRVDCFHLCRKLQLSVPLGDNVECSRSSVLVASVGHCNRWLWRYLILCYVARALLDVTRPANLSSWSMESPLHVAATLLAAVP